MKNLSSFTGMLGTYIVKKSDFLHETVGIGLLLVKESLIVNRSDGGNYGNS